jgi:lysophospholipase L1-like esterase/pimeloyl-ACP methyl ester carboxylesterase
MRLLTTLSALLLVLPAWADRIAVIGDSISTGAHAENRQRDGFPGRLSTMFAGRHEVRAFAKSGHTLLRKADSPLVNTTVFQAAIDWKPDTAVIMLGTNDSSEKRPNWKHHADLETDARFMIDRLRGANPDLTVHFVGPPPMFPNRPNLPAGRKPDLEQRAPNLLVIRDVYRRIADAESRVFHHDITRTLTADRTSDGVHPDTQGHENIAQHLHAILSIEFDESHNIAASLQKIGANSSVKNFHGYRRHDFQLPGNGAACRIVAPQQSAAGRPWIWRARFFGHQPGLDLELLDRGYHLAYCDVGNLYGAPAALDRWDAFHTFATGTLGLAPKPILEGMSRGGLPIFLWASRNPGKVAAIYGDNPVCDFRSWPGGKPGKGSPGDWARLLKAYGITGEQAAAHPQPVDEVILTPIAAAKIPVALVLGTADDVVPPAANGEALAATYQKIRGPVKVWRKPGLGHHPHGLHPPGPLREFLTR